MLAVGAALAGLGGALAARSLSNGRGGPLKRMRHAVPGKSRSRGVSLPKFVKRRRGVRGGVRNISQNVTEAAKQADRLGRRMSTVAKSVQRVSETADDAAKEA